VPRPALEVADVFGRFGASFLKQHPASAQQRRVVAAITSCRTAALGGHLERCDACGHERNAYNSCRDRHCPKCGSLAREQWIAARSAELLPIPYFHVVFTLPEFLRPVAWQNQAAIYNILFHAAASALQKVAADPKHLGARIGLLAVLHTWNQKLLYHPHIHCIVSGGGLSPDGKRWVAAPGKYLLPVKVLSKVYRGIFMQALRQAYREGQLSWYGELQHLQEETAFNHFIQAAWEKNWVVYSKAPFAGPQRMVATVGRYTHGIAMSNQRLIRLDPPLIPILGNQQVVDYLGKHCNRIAITNDRLIDLNDATVTFSWRDRDTGRLRPLTIPGHEFMRRFLLHVLPRHFVRLRHYGFLANAHRTEQLALCRRLLGAAEPAPDVEPAVHWKTRLEELTGIRIDQCPMCHDGRMHNVATLLPQRRPRPSSRPTAILIWDSS
jgi:hypothetical protein